MYCTCINPSFVMSSVNPAALISNVELRPVEESVEVWLNDTDYEAIKVVVIVIEVSLFVA